MLKPQETRDNLPNLTDEFFILQEKVLELESDIYNMKKREC